MTHRRKFLSRAWFRKAKFPNDCDELDEQFKRIEASGARVITQPDPKLSAGTVSESTKRAVRAAVKNLGLQPSDYTAIYRALAASRSPQESIKSQGQKVYPLVKEIHAQLATTPVGNS